MSQKLNVSLDNSKLTLTERSRGRMKINIKLSKEEAEALKAFQQMVKPEEVSEEVFLKQVFFIGLRTLDQELKEMFEAKKAELDAQRTQALSQENIPVTEPTV
jgi:hypothetical protein